MIVFYHVARNTFRECLREPIYYVLLVTAVFLIDLLLNLSLYAGVGCLEWYLALRRTLACARGEKVTLIILVFIENLLGLWVLQNFIASSDWTIAIVYSAGAALGALLVSGKTEKNAAPVECESKDAAAVKAKA